MAVPRLDPRIGPANLAAIGEQQPVDHLRAATVPAFYQQRAGALPHCRLTTQRVEFGQVGRGHRGDAHQPGEGGDRCLVSQSRTTGRDHDGIEHDRHARHRLESRRHGVGSFGRADHADLHGVHADIGDDRVDLGDHHVGRNGVNALHAEGILRGDGRDRGHRVAAEHGDRLDIRLDARAAARIGAGDDEDAGGHARPLNFRSVEAG